MESTAVAPRLSIRLALLLALLFIVRVAQSVSGQTSTDQRGLALPPKPVISGLGVGNYYALVIGINDYQPPMKKLKTAVSDATAIGQVLDKRYGFQVKYLLNQDATRSNILSALGKYRNSLNEDDSLLIYFAGHGYSDREADKAYWLPVDAESGTSVNRIIADDLTSDVKVIPSRHVLIVSDSCYSGSLSRGTDEPEHADDSSAFLARMLISRSRTLLSSGGDEPVADNGTDGHSVFAYALLQGLAQTTKPAFTAGDFFYSSVRQQVAGRSEQLPEYATIRNSNSGEGDFVFRLKPYPSPSAPNRAQVPTTAATRGLALYRSFHFKEALPLLISACEGGDAITCLYAGETFSGGNQEIYFDFAQGVVEDKAQAGKYFRLACEGGAMHGCTRLGHMYTSADVDVQNDDRVTELYRKSCDGEDGDGCFALGDLPISGQGAEQNNALYIRGASLHLKSCEGGDTVGCDSLGADYTDGNGVTKNLALAAQAYRRACDGGYLASCLTLGEAYLQTKGSAQSRGLAVTLLSKSCEGGQIDGCLYLGEEYYIGNILGKDREKAAELFRKGCGPNAGYRCKFKAEIVDTFGVTGKLKPGNFDLAVEIDRNSCDAGNLESCDGLGSIYENGIGVGKNLPLAMKLYTQACDGGVAGACDHLKSLKP